MLLSALLIDALLQTCHGVLLLHCCMIQVLLNLHMLPDHDIAHCCVQVSRKRAFNMMEDMKGKIRVYARIRPILKFETDKGQVSSSNCTVHTVGSSVTILVLSVSGTLVAVGAQMEGHLLHLLYQYLSHATC